MTMTRYTPEQCDLMDYVELKDGIVLVAAGAGTGKSFMSEQIAKKVNPTNALYTAFNKAIVLEGKDRFKGLNVECKTFHALAWKYVKPKGDIGDLTYTCITENITYTQKAAVIAAIDAFFVSSSTDMYDFMEDLFDDKKDKFLAELSTSYIDKMLECEVAPTYNFMLKCFHLMLVSGDVVCYYDLVILDEINDVTAVFLEIFKLIDAPKKLGLGETHQAIYQFLNLVNGFEEMPNTPIMALTQSFRCSETIASKIQNFMRTDLDPSFTFVGTD